MNDNSQTPRGEAETAVIRTQTATVIRLLLAGGKLGSGVMISGGDRLDAAQRRSVAETANAERMDLLHLEFGHGADGSYGLVGIVLICPRAGVCHTHTDCRLYVCERGASAMILPQPHVRGAFRLAKHELIHVSYRPSDEAAGIARATDLIPMPDAASTNDTDAFQMIEVVAA